MKTPKCLVARLRDQSWEWSDGKDDIEERSRVRGENRGSSVRLRGRSGRSDDDDYGVASSGGRCREPGIGPAVLADRVRDRTSTGARAVGKFRG